MSPLERRRGCSRDEDRAKRSRAFRLLQPRRRECTYTVRGTASGGSLQGHVVDHSGGTVLSKTYSGSTRDKCPSVRQRHHRNAHREQRNRRQQDHLHRHPQREEGSLCGGFDGSNVRQLTHDNTISVHPSLSPDGRRIAYTGYQSGYADVYVIDLASGARNRIVNFPGTNSGAAFSPDGSGLALTISKDGNPELYTVSASGGGARRLTRTRGVESGPTWSPEGDEIIYSSDEGGSPQLYRISSRRRSGQFDFDRSRLLHRAELVAGRKEDRVQRPRAAANFRSRCSIWRRRHAHGWRRDRIRFGARIRGI